MKINIAGGTGLMGKIHKPVFEASGHEVTLSGRQTIPNLEEAAQQSDLTIVSVPIPVTEAVIKRVAPYCQAIMDFTSVKTFPISAMIQYAPTKSEVAGLHPLYGDVESIEGRTVVCCPTERAGNRCTAVVNSLRKAGAEIKEMTPEEHDKISDYTQNRRTQKLEEFGLSCAESGLSFKEFYELSPPPTRALLDLLARQVDKKNDELYVAMREYNPFSIEEDNFKQNRERLRTWFGNSLEAAQERAKGLI